MGYIKLFVRNDKPLVAKNDFERISVKQLFKTKHILIYGLYNIKKRQNVLTI